MLESQRLNLKLQEIRSRFNALAALDELDEAGSAELDTLDTKYANY